MTLANLTHGTPFLPLTFFLINGLPGCLSGSALHPYCILYEEATPKQVYPFSQRRHFEPVGRHHGHIRVMYAGSYHKMAINARRDPTCISPFRNFILSVTADITIQVMDHAAFFLLRRAPISGQSYRDPAPLLF